MGGSLFSVCFFKVMMTYFIMQTSESDLQDFFPPAKLLALHNKESHWTLCLQYRQVTRLV